MKIETILIRKGGTKVTFGENHEVEYHFKPDAKGRHVAEVEDPDHIGSLLAIREGYRIVPNEAAAETSGESKSVDDGLEALDRVALSELFKMRFGIVPQAALSKAKIIEALRQPEA